jgi:hypothetical protein
MGTTVRLLVCLLIALTFGACRQETKTGVRQTLIGWRPVGEFSGRGNSQTESFNIESGQWRIKWATTDERPAGAGTFEVTVHSAVSGRPLGVPIEHKGIGRDTVYINEDPRLYHLVIESNNVAWSVAIEEAVVGYAQRGKQLR